MNAGTLLLIIVDIVTLLKAEGIILPDGSFDATKVDSISEDIELARKVLQLLEAYGLETPDRVEKILQLLPLIASIIR